MATRDRPAAPASGRLEGDRVVSCHPGGSLPRAGGQACVFTSPPFSPQDDGAIRVWKNFADLEKNPEMVTAWQGLSDMLPTTRGGCSRERRGPSLPARPPASPWRWLPTGRLNCEPPLSPGCPGALAGQETRPPEGLPGCGRTCPHPRPGLAAGAAGKAWGPRPVPRRAPFGGRAPWHAGTSVRTAEAADPRPGGGTQLPLHTGPSGAHRAAVARGPSGTAGFQRRQAAGATVSLLS